MSWQGGSSIFHSRTKGRLHTGAHRRRMPWSYVKEKFPRIVLNQRDRTLLDGSELPIGIERAVQKDPMDILKYIVARHEYDRSTGETLLQIACRMPCMGRGQKFYRKEWMEGTYEKFVTLCHVSPEPKNCKLGTAFGYLTFHGESSLRPIEIDAADVPGWYSDFDASRAIPHTAAVPAPESIGTEIPIDTSLYRVRSYPCYEPPPPPQYVEQLLKDRGVLPSVFPSNSDNKAAQSDTESADSSVEYTPNYPPS